MHSSPQLTHDFHAEACGLRRQMTTPVHRRLRNASATTRMNAIDSSHVRQVLRSCSKGQLRYDRNWERDGRGEEIISDINARLVAIPISPRSDIFTRDTMPEYHSIPLSLKDLSFSDQGSESFGDDCSAIPDHGDQTDHHPLRQLESKVESKYIELLKESERLDEEENEIREREIRNHGLHRETEKRWQKVHSEAIEFIDSLLRKSPSPSSSSISMRLQEVEWKKKQQLQEREQAKQEALQRKVRTLIAVIHSEVRRTVKSLHESLADHKSLRQHVKDTEESLKPLVATIDSIAGKTSYTDDDHSKLSEEKKSVIATCSKALEKRDALLFALKQQSQDVSSPNAASPLAAAETASPHAPERAGTPAPPAVRSPEVDTFKEYVKSRSFVNDFETRLKSFVEGEKSYRIQLQQFIRTQINAISPTSNDHLKQKFQKLQALFDQQDVEFQEQRLNTRGHVLAFDFCLDYAAKTMLSVGSKQVLSVPKAAFSFAAVIALLWQKEERFGQLFLGHLLERCPYIGGYYPERDADEDEVRYLICCGYVYGSGKTLESEESFLNRMRSYTRIYGALVQSKARHPHGMRYAWIWLSRTLQVEPKPGISAALLHAFLDVALYRLHEFYKSQCLKLLSFLATDYIPRIERNSAQEIKKQSVAQLKIFVNDAISKIRRNKSLKNEGVLSDYFWQTSYLNS